MPKLILSKIWFRIRFALWVWPSIIGALVCLCGAFGFFYLLSFLFPIFVHNAGIQDTSVPILTVSILLILMCCFAFFRPIEGGLATSYVLELISLVISLFRFSPIGIVTWLIMIAFSTWSIFRSYPPYYHGTHMDDLESQYRILIRKKRQEEKIKKNVNLPKE